MQMSQKKDLRLSGRAMGLLIMTLLSWLQNDCRIKQDKACQRDLPVPIDVQQADKLLPGFHVLTHMQQYFDSGLECIA